MFSDRQTQGIKFIAARFGHIGQSDVGTQSFINSLDELLSIKSYMGRILPEIRKHYPCEDYPSVEFSKYHLDRLVIQETSGKYPTDLETIHFDERGNVKLCPDYLKPDDVERESIKKEFSRVPRSVPVFATELEGLYEQFPKIKNGTEYLFKTRPEKNCSERILMVQVRYETNSGKVYVPYSYWNDGIWRNKLPTGDTPLYGLEQLANSTYTVFLHEGVKGVEYCKNLATTHPWYDYLSTGIHLGWINGAKAVDKTDWSILNKLDVKKVFIIADNDIEGEECVKHIAKRLHCITWQVQFDDRFPVGFDLADTIPDELFKKGIYTGPKLKELIRPATWLTKQIGKDFQLRSHVFGVWEYLFKTEQVVCLDNPEFIFKESAFNKYVAKFCHPRINAAWLIRNNRIKNLNCPAYRPDMEGKKIIGDTINVYKKPTIEAVDKPADKFLSFMEYLIPHESERAELLKWVATLIARPEIRMGYGVLLFSQKQGVGKTTLSDEILAPLVGRDNVSTVSEIDFQSSFNSWAVNKRLVVCPEIYQSQSWKVYNMLKSVVTDRIIRVNEKHLPSYESENWCHVFASSNSPRALKIDNSDRRWLVPEVVEYIWPQKKYSELRAWLEVEGLGIVKYWAENYSDYVCPGDHAPLTETKERMISDSQSTYITLLHDWADEYTEKEVCAGVRTLHDWVKSQVKEECWDTKAELRAVLDSRGFIKVTPDEELGLSKQERLRHRYKETIYVSESLYKKLKQAQGRNEVIGLLKGHEHNAPVPM